MLSEGAFKKVKAHSYRVGILMSEFIEYRDLRSLRGVYMVAGCYHDVGKLLMPENLLFKKGSLTTGERDIVESHVVHSANLLLAMGMNKTILDCAMYHHECDDGSGYPFKLKGEEIPYIARVCHIADVFDALWEDRPYRDGLDISLIKKIMNEMNDNGKFDYEIFKVFMEMIGEDNFVPNYINILSRSDCSISDLLLHTNNQG